MVAAGDGELVVRGIQLSFGVRGEEEVVEVGAQTGNHVKSKFIFPNFRKKKFPHFSEV